MATVVTAITSRKFPGRHVATLALTIGWIAVLPLSPATAQTTSWTGTTSNDWNTGTNWSAGKGGWRVNW